MKLNNYILGFGDPEFGAKLPLCTFANPHLGEESGSFGVFDS